MFPGFKRDFFFLTEWVQCPYDKDPCTAGDLKGTKNSHCVKKPGAQTVACRCDSGHFGRPQLPSCMKDSGGKLALQKGIEYSVIFFHLFLH